MRDSKMSNSNIVSFRGEELAESDVDILEELESLAGKELSEVEEVKDNTKMGFTAENNRVSGLGLHICGLTTLPESIGNLKSLERLELQYNSITTLPESITKLTSLTYLSLGSNSITTLPESIGNLTSLEYLSLWGNSISTLPESIGNLTSLEKLYLNNNDLSTLPESITMLKSLKELGLQHNDLSTLPESITKLTSLKILRLNSNFITTLPESIFNLKNLTELDIDAEVKLVWTGDELPPKESLPKGLQKYFTRIILKEPKPSRILIRRLKVFCVGAGGVGKTSLLKRLQHEQYVEGRDSTVGLNVEKLSFNGKEDTFTQEVIWWDYGGQRGYLPTHRFFFSRDAVYLLVMRADHDIGQNKLYEWIAGIRGRAPNALVVPIATWKDRLKTGGRSILEGGEGQRLRRILAGFNIDQTPLLISNKEKENKGVERVETQLKALLQEGGSTYQVPKGYLEVEEFIQLLKREGEVFMSRDSFLERLRAELRERKWEGISSGWLERMGLHQLHEHGIIFYTNELFPASDLVIVNVDQANKVLATIVDEVSRFQGRVGKADLEKILRDKCSFAIHTLQNLGKILELLGELGLAYRDLSAPKDEEQWIFPLYLTEPREDWVSTEQYWKDEAYSKGNLSLMSLDETLFSRVLFQLSFNGRTIGVWRQKNLRAGATVHHALVSFNRNNEGIALTLNSDHHNKQHHEIEMWFKGLTSNMEQMIFTSMRRYIRQEYRLQESSFTKLRERDDLPSEMARKVYAQLSQDYQYLNRRLDRQYRYFNDELRKIIRNMDDLQRYIDDNVDRLKEFIAQIQKKLPMPSRMEMDKKLLGLRKELTLYFTCGRHQSVCECPEDEGFTITTSEWSKWFRITVSAVKVGYNVFRMKAGKVKEGIKTIKELKEVYDECKTDEFPEFHSLAREPFLTSEERDELIENLRENDFFNTFEYDKLNAEWICNNCASER